MPRLLIPPNEMIPGRRCRAYRATAHLQTLAASSCRSFTDHQLLSLSRRVSPPLLRARRSALITLLQSAAEAAPSALQPAPPLRPASPPHLTYRSSTTAFLLASVCTYFVRKTSTGWYGRKKSTRPIVCTCFPSGFTEPGGGRICSVIPSKTPVVKRVIERV